MNTLTAGLLWILIVPAAPAPKVQPGIPNELIDVLPEDTAAVLVMDGKRFSKTAFGAAFWKGFAAAQGPDEQVRVADIARDVEFALIAQFLIEKHAGDFCFVLRLREGSELPKTLMAEAEKDGRPAVPEKIGKRSVYSFGSPGGSFARLDDRTLMVVLASGNGKQTERTRAAAYADRERPGPNAVLRKMLADEPADVPAVRLYGHHSTKLGHSAGLVMAIFGVEFEALSTLGEKVVSYRGGIRVGDAAEIELRFTLRNADAAKEFLNAYDTVAKDDPVLKEWRKACKAVRDGDDVIVTGKATPALIDRMSTKPNK